ncbi:MAG: hypothetical protein EZS28_028408 [Streblomastix strix]|uniref:Dynein regulatory complex protein 10 n=1 Tax=Streblomastix strix TaxID=222440 RepID=A0A5J4V201_9EUKA|nr:MAG: hypothetical protein EZS28_028408 [Streblomastix strix]
MNRLTTTEAARVIAVLRDTKEKVEILLDIHLEQVTPEIPPEFVPEHILSELIKHKELETKYIELIEEGKDIKQTQLRQKIKENQQEQHDTAEKIKSSCQSLVRLLKANPATMEQLKLLGQRSDTAKSYIEVFELLVKFSKIRLETTVEEELEKIKRMEVLAARESKVMTDKASLKKELESEEKTRSKEVQMLRENEQRLAAQITKMKNENRAFLNKCATDFAAMNLELEERHKQRMAELKQQNDALTEELETLLRDNRMREREIRKTKQQTCQEIENRIAGYDTGMNDKRNQHIRQEEKLEDEKNEIVNLEGKVRMLDKRHKVDEFQIKLQEKRLENERNEKAARNRKIAIIQALYRRRQAIKQIDIIKKQKQRKKKKKKK